MCGDPETGEQLRQAVSGDLSAQGAPRKILHGGEKFSREWRTRGIRAGRPDFPTHGGHPRAKPHAGAPAPVRTHPPAQAAAVFAWIPGFISLKSESKSPVFTSASWFLSSWFEMFPAFRLRFLQAVQLCARLPLNTSYLPPRTCACPHAGTRTRGPFPAHLSERVAWWVSVGESPFSYSTPGGPFSAPAHALPCRNIPPADSCPPRSQRLDAGRFLIAAFILPHPETQQKALYAFSLRVP